MPIIYHKTLAEFRNDISSKRIASAIKTSGYEDEVGKLPSSEEEKSWENSLGALCTALDGLDGGLDVYAEYVLPPDSFYRADFIITGFNVDGKRTAVIIELKQWSNGSIFLRKEQPKNSVHCIWDDCDEELPTHQVLRYAHHLQTHCSSVRTGEVILHPCVFLHNYKEPEDKKNDPLFSEETDIPRIYYNGQGELLKRYISERIISPDFGNTIKELENHNNHILDPRLIDTLTNTLEGGESFKLNFEKEVVFSKVKDAYEKDKKTVVLITGAPGTGKTVLAIRLMGYFRQKGLTVRYVTHSQNLRYLFIDKFCSDYTEMEREKGHILTSKENKALELTANELFSYPISFAKVVSKDVSIVDEAHRLQRNNNGLYDNQAEIIIENSTLSVFLIDDDQQVRWQDYCTTAIIEEYANQKGYQLISFHLNEGVRQYTPFIDWATALFSPKPTTLKMNPNKFLVKVYDKASNLYSDIVRFDMDGNRSRMVAGFCWDWKSRKKSKTTSNQDISLSDRDGNPDLKLMWNLYLEKYNYSHTWIGRDDSVDEVGCIHTAQGIDMDYVGVIIGKDVTYNKTVNVIEFHVEEHPKGDTSVTIDTRNNIKVDPQNAERLIRNAYRVLMTRSTKGCLIFCVDKDLSDYIKAHLR